MKNKEYKLINLLFILIAFMTCLSFTGCKNGNDDENDPNNGNEEPIVEPISLIGLDVANQKTNYNLGEPFDKSNITATAHYSNGTTEEVSSLINIDANQFDSSKDGTYEIIVSYSKNNASVKSFYFAVVGTGIDKPIEDEPDPEPDVFGPGTYKFDAAVDLAEYLTNAKIDENTKFGQGYYTIKGTETKRANATAFAMELAKNEGSWIEFNVTGTATITIKCSSTGSSNFSAIALFDSENELINNNEGITTVETTTATTLTYNVTTGTYRILSQSGTTYSTRGVRIYGVEVVQE